MKLFAIISLTLTFGLMNTTVQAKEEGATAPLSAKFNPAEYKNDSNSGLDLQKIYDTISELRKTQGVGGGELTKVTMYMSVKGKLVDAVKTLTALVNEREKTKDKRVKAEIQQKIDTHKQTRIEPLRAELGRAGEEIMAIYGINPTQLAQIPSFQEFQRGAR